MIPRRVLVALDNAHEADALRARDAVRALRSAWSAAHFTLLASPRVAAVLREDFDRVVTSRLYELATISLRFIKPRKTVEAVRIALRLGAGHDVAVVLGNGTTAIDAIARFAAHRVVGYANRFPSLLSSSLGPYDPYGDVEAQYERLLEACGVAAIDPVPREHDDERVAAVLARAGLAGSRYVVAHTGSDWACQQWLPERWAELCDRIARERGAMIVFTGTARERPYVEAIRARMGESSISLAGLTTIAELEAVISGAALCVTVDSAAYDVAVATGTRTIVLAGASDTRRPPRSPAPIVVDRTPAELREAIVACKEPKDVFGGCLRYECPMAGLRHIAVEDVFAEIAGTALERAG